MSSLQAIRNALEGTKLVLMLHRLQPIPHYTDVEGTTSHSYLKFLGEFQENGVIALNREEDARDERPV